MLCGTKDDVVSTAATGVELAAGGVGDGGGVLGGLVVAGTLADVGDSTNCDVVVVLGIGVVDSLVDSLVEVLWLLACAEDVEDVEPVPSTRSPICRPIIALPSYLLLSSQLAWAMESTARAARSCGRACFECILVGF